MPNGDFESLDNDDSEEAPIVGLLGSYDREFGTGPWSASGTGVLSVLAAPETTIGSGVATVSGLASINVVGLVSNSARFYQDNIGATFLDGYTYTLTASIITTDTLDLTGLTNAGVGIGLLANGTSTPASGAGAALDLDILGANTGTLTYTFTAGPGQSGQDIGVELFTGRGSGLADVDALGSVSFNNVSLSAVPEPNAFALIAGLAAAAWTLRRNAQRTTVTS